MFVGSVTNPGSSPEVMLFCRATTAGATLLSGMPVPSPVSHAKQQADAKIAELQAKLAALEAVVSALQPQLLLPFAARLPTPSRHGPAGAVWISGVECRSRLGVG